MFDVKRVSVLWNDTIERLLRQPEYRVLGTVPAPPTQHCVFQMQNGQHICQVVPFEPDKKLVSGFLVVQCHPLLIAARSLPSPNMRVFDAPMLLSWKSGTWEDMYISQPPCEVIHLRISSSRGTQTLKVNDGITWKHLIKALHQWKSSSYAARRSIDMNEIIVELDRTVGET